MHNMATITNPLRSCRFCLRIAPDMRTLPHDTLPHTDIPQLFETVTSMKLDFSPGYSELLCADCEQRLRNAAQVRADFVRVAQQWHAFFAEVQVNADPLTRVLEYLHYGDDCAGHSNPEYLAKSDEENDHELMVECLAKSDEENDHELMVDVKVERQYTEDDDQFDGRDPMVSSPTPFTEDESPAPAWPKIELSRRKRGRPPSFGAVRPGERYTCDICSVQLTTKQIMLNHIINVHVNKSLGKQASFDCAQCSMSCPTASELKRHMIMHNTSNETSTKRKRGRPPLFGSPAPGERFTCDICNTQLVSKLLLVNHMSRVHHYPEKIQGSTCHICGKTNLRSMKHHMQDHRRANKFKCSFCPRSFNRSNMKRQHERTHTGERPFVCEICGFSFTTPSGLKSHTLVRHNAATADQPPATLSQRQKQQVVRQRVLPPPPPSPKLGDEDDTSLVSSSRLPAADPIPHNGRLECPICLKTYANRPSMHTHMKMMHASDNMVQWKQFLATVCVVCNEQCADATALRIHRRIHQPFECEICRRRFETRITWELHVRIHAIKERPFRCEVCEAQFPSAFTMRMHHRRAHTDYRPYACDLCPLTFAENGELGAHIRKKHTSNGPKRSYTCHLCPVDSPAFLTSEALRLHIENHTGNYRYQCKVCFKRQTTLNHLLEHMRRFHPAELGAMSAEGAEGASVEDDDDKELKSCKVESI